MQMQQSNAETQSDPSGKLYVPPSRAGELIEETGPAFQAVAEIQTTLELAVSAVRHPTS